MSRDIVIFDKLADIKQLSNDDAFLEIEKRFQEEKSRYLSKLLHPDTSSEDTLQLKAVVNALKEVSPMGIADKILKVQAKQLKSEHPEMWRTKKK